MCHCKGNAVLRLLGNSGAFFVPQCRGDLSGSRDSLGTVRRHRKWALRNKNFLKNKKKVVTTFHNGKGLSAWASISPSPAVLCAGNYSQGSRL